MGKVAQTEAFMMRRIMWPRQPLQTTLGKSFPPACSRKLSLCYSYRKAQAKLTSCEHQPGNVPACSLRLPASSHQQTGGTWGLSGGSGVTCSPFGWQCRVLQERGAELPSLHSVYQRGNSFCLRSHAEPLPAELLQPQLLQSTAESLYIP